MNKSYFTVASIISLISSLGHSQVPQKGPLAEYRDKEIDKIELHLDQQQRIDLYNTLKMMKVEISDWKKYSPDAAPSKCIGIDD